MLLKNVDQLNIGHSRLIFTTYYKFGKIFPCNLLNVAKKKLHTLSNGPTSIPKTFLSSVKETEPESNRYLDLPDTLHILSHSMVQPGTAGYSRVQPGTAGYSLVQQGDGAAPLLQRRGC